ncbi:MAG: four helix bundle protein [Patescibacteria group bacterium]|nr:four helix bundle protein [Patescibacteria group bacterium]
MMNTKSIKTYKDLVVWQKAHFLVLEVYKITKNYPSEERFALTSQTRRAVSSTPANIAEGFSRQSLNNYLNHLDIANGSLEETKYHLLLAKDLKYLSSIGYEKLILLADDVGRLLNGLIKSLRNKK